MADCFGLGRSISAIQCGLLEAGGRLWGDRPRGAKISFGMVRGAAERAASALPPRLKKAAMKIERDAAKLQEMTKGKISTLTKNKISVEIMRLESESSKLAEQARQSCKPRRSK
jgi:hypothetical protein